MFVQLEVVVDQRRRAGCRLFLANPPHQGRSVRGGFIESGVPAPGPALNLTAYESVGPAEITETDRIGINSVETGKNLGDHHADTPAEFRLAVGNVGIGSPQHQTVAPLHDMKVCAENGVVGTQHVASGRQTPCPPQARENAMFTAHVMGRRRDRPQWRAPQHILAPGEVEEIGQIGVTAAELANGERPGGPLDVVAQPGFETF